MELPALPRRILFVGGGFISFEFAHIAARAGSTPVILDRGPRPLKAFDPDLVELLISRGGEVGIELWRSTTITAIERSRRGFRVSVERSGQSETVGFDLVVHGAGRVPELAGLNLDAAAVEWDERGVRVSPHLQSTSNAAVYAAGDAVETAELVFGETVLPARPSDAIAIALRSGRPIQCSEELLAEVGVSADELGAAPSDGLDSPEDEVERFLEFLDSVTPDDFTGDEGKP